MRDPSDFLLCPAKINLFLEIRSKREDGFHELGTLFQALDFGDKLAVFPHDDLILDGATSIPGKPEDNLILKAARALLGEPRGPRSRSQGGRFLLEKVLPTGAGLGGGSSDAAGALLLLNRHWDLQLERSRLMEIGASLGSDVAFFLMGGTAFGEGRGEILKAAPEPFPFHIVVGTPHCSVGTPWAYQQIKAPYRNEWSKFKALYHLCNEEQDFYNTLRNDFEGPVLQAFPEIAALHEKIRAAGAIKTLLSGSGSSVFGLFLEKSAAQKALETISGSCRFSGTSRIGGW